MPGKLAREVRRVSREPGVALTVLANSATFKDGSRVGRASITQVHGDKVPMAPIEGAAPRLVWTLQPAGAEFNPMAISSVEIHTADVTVSDQIGPYVRYLVTLGYGADRLNGRPLLSDPFGGDLDVYRDTCQELEALAAAVAERLAAESKRGDQR